MVTVSEWQQPEVTWELHPHRSEKLQLLTHQMVYLSTQTAVSSLSAPEGGKKTTTTKKIKNKTSDQLHHVSKTDTNQCDKSVTHGYGTIPQLLNEVTPLKDPVGSVPASWLRVTALAVMSH